MTGNVEIWLGRRVSFASFLGLWTWETHPRNVETIDLRLTLLSTELH